MERRGPFALTFAFTFVLTIMGLAFTLLGASSTAAQPALPGAGAPVDETAPTLPDGTLSEEAIRRVLSELDDRQVRALLLERLAAEAAALEAEMTTEAESGLADTISRTAANFGTYLIDVARKVPAIPGEVAKSLSTFAEARGEAPFWRFPATLLASLAAGILASQLLCKALAFGRVDSSVADGNERALIGRMRKLGLRFLAHAMGVIVFAVVALAVNAWANANVPADQSTIAAIISASAWTAFFFEVSRFVLAPASPALRLCPMNTAHARWLSRRVLLLAGVFSFGFGFVQWMAAFGSPFHASWLGFWVSALLHSLLAATVWQGREHLRQVLVPHGEQAPAPLGGELAPREGGAETGRLMDAWPAIVTGLVAAHFVLIGVVVANFYVPDTLLTAMAVTLVVLMGLPFFDRGMRAVLAAATLHRLSDPPALHAANVASLAGYVRMARGMGLIVLVLLVLWRGGLDVVTLAERGVSARFASAVVETLLIVGFAYVAWEAVRIVTERQIAKEQVTRGIDPSAGEAEGEGGAEGARLGTLLPLVRGTAQVFIAVLALLAVLGEFGVNVVPLLAGAGVVGLAIGFGAQTLVKDIVAGVFFLIDDAFRKGEYIDLGEVKGTVERISVRSMQLRHHRGILNTVPFGDIRNVANMSRDWVIMKFPLRVTYDTDAETVRKLVKKLGEKLLEHPEHGRQFLQPLKCQGVVEMEDSAMIMPVKFMSRPGEQWLLRRVVLNEIHKLFEANGIKFASREVTVRISGDGKETELTDEDRRAIAGAASRRLLDVEEAPRDGAAAVT